MAIQEAGLKFLEKSLTNGRAIPGQSLTNSKDQPQNWERPPRHTDPREAMYAVFNSLIEPEVTANILLSINKGVGILDIASIMLYTGFIEGQWNPDLMLILMEPTMYMIMALAEKAEIPYVIETGDEKEVIERDPKESLKLLNEEIISLDDIRKKAASKISSQVVPKEIREAVKNVTISPSLLERIQQDNATNNDSLLSAKEIEEETGVI
tara:strand:+ start:625 stop:1254 length:630 start_codon:yes stop_codon:yes gene_type:complete